MTGVRTCPIAHPVVSRPDSHPTWSVHLIARLRARTVAFTRVHSVVDADPLSICSPNPSASICCSSRCLVFGGLSSGLRAGPRQGRGANG